MEVPCTTCGKAIQRGLRQVRERNYCSPGCHYASGAPRPSRKLGTVKQCQVCGADFYAGRTRPDARFCSRACKGRASRVMFTCEVCGTETYGFQNHAKRWCGRKCAAVARRTGSMATCLQCGTEFYAVRGRIATGWAGFCTNACHNTWHGRNKTDHTCKMCGQGFRWSPSRSAAGKYNITYCSLACRDADPAVKARLLEMIAGQQSRKMTTPERIGYGLLDGLAVNYESQAVFAGKFCVDSRLPDHMLVIQFDGDYWHDRKGASTEPRIRRRVALDRSQDAYMAACGWRVLRLWESDLKGDPQGCRALITQHLSPPS